ncbi:hypothetical protein [Nocardia sp. NPDC049526]|uniref:hypothetical protein n=1 Tax=Nocardia sp. NPDC049526 TaxID=3364316 RepID=UPI003790A332
MAEWHWESDDFAALWFSLANDRFPDPLRFTSRFAYRDDFDAHRATVRERYSPDELEEIHLALHTLTTSTIRIQIFGGTTRHENPDGGVRVYRIVGARTDQRAMSLIQATSATPTARSTAVSSQPTTSPHNSPTAFRRTNRAPNRRPPVIPTATSGTNAVSASCSGPPTAADPPCCTRPCRQGEQTPRHRPLARHQR